MSERAPSPSRLGRLAALDFSAGRPALVLIMLVLGTRLPLIGGGYGADTDAYRVRLTADYLWRHGEYIPSRLPGFPLHELTVIVLSWGGSLVSNASTVLASLVAVLLFARIVRVLSTPNRGLTVLGFVLAPLMLVTATTTIDYQWSLAGLLGAYLASLTGRPVWAGVLLGVAAGFRITALAFLLPLLLPYALQRQWKAMAAIAGAAMATAFIIYLPVMIPYRFRFLDFADSRVSPDGVIRVVGQWVLGAIGALMTLAALAASWRRIASLPRRMAANPQIAVWALAAAVYAALFLRLPVDTGYLVPVVPFGFLLLATTVSRAWLAAVVAAVAISGGIDLDIQQLHNIDPRVAVRTVRPSVRVAALVHDQRERRRWQAYADAIVAQDVPEGSAVITGGAFPVVAVRRWGVLPHALRERDRRAISMLSDAGEVRDPNRDVVYLPTVEPAVLDAYRGRGYALFRADPAGTSGRQALLTPVP